MVGLCAAVAALTCAFQGGIVSLFTRGARQRAAEKENNAKLDKTV